MGRLRFLAACVGIWHRGAWYLDSGRNGDHHLNKNARLKVPKDNLASKFGPELGTRADRKMQFCANPWRRAGLSVLCWWMHRTALLFLLLLVVCGLTSVDALEEITNGNIKTAVGNWKDNNPSADAIAQYGRIEDWDVSRVTKMNSCKLSFLYCVVHI